MKVTKDRKEFLIAFIVILLMYIILIVLTQYTNNNPEKYLSYIFKLGISNTPMYEDVEVIDTYGGFPEDGDILITYYFSHDDIKKIITEIESNEHWKQLSEAEYCLIKEELQTVKNGYGYYHSLESSKTVYDRYNPEKNKELGGYNSLECEVGVLDVDRNRLYYYRREI